MLFLLRHGALAVSPILFTLTLFNRQARSQTRFWDSLGYVPNLEAATNKRSDSSIGIGITSAQKCQDEHVCLLFALRQIKDINDRGGIPMVVMNRKVKVKVWIHYIVGDISGNNVLLGSYNNANANCPYRDCTCPSAKFPDPNADCTLIRKADIDQLKKENNRIGLQAVSKHNIRNAFDTIPTGNPTDGIYHLTPPETMHTIDSGIAPRIIQNIGPKLKEKRPAELMNNVHLLLVRSHQKQSERSASSRPQSRNHIWETTKTQATETMGNLFLIMCSFHTTTGRTACKLAEVSDPQRRGKIKTIMMVLALEKWLNRRNRRTDIDDPAKIQNFIRHEVIPNLQKYFPRKDGMGWTFPKVHSLTKFALYIQWFGAGRNFYGGTGESMLKTFMKHLSKFTQRRADTFARQLAENHYQQSLFEHSANCIREQTNSNYVRQDDVVQRQFSGKHHVTFTRKPTGSVEYGVSVKWPKASSSQPLDSILRYTISQYMAEHDPSRHEFHLLAFTSATLPNNRETLDEYDAGPRHSLYKIDTRVNRYDWCMIQAHKLGSETANERFDIWGYTCPAQIHGFLRFDSEGIPTPCLLQKHEDNANAIRALGIKDDTMYVIVRTHKKFLTWKELEKQFVVPIELGPLDGKHGCTYILPVSRIVNPLFVFEDHGQQDTPTSFFATLPARYHAFYIDHWINPNLITGAGGLSQRCDEEQRCDDEY